MFGWARSLLGGATEAVLSLRRWDAAKTDRTNQATWRGVSAQNVNQDLALDRDTIVQRATHEAENNPFVAGVIETHASSIVGATGPILQVVSDSEPYNQALEAIYYDWSQAPELTGQMSLVELLRLSVRLLWTNGEWLFQETDDAAVRNAVSYRLNMIHPRRLRNPLTGWQLQIVLGVSRDMTNGKPLAYHLTDFTSDEYGWVGNALATREFAAAEIIHGFQPLEPGQVRGLPWLAPSLPTVADLRSYDATVLKAAKVAAKHGAMLVTSHVDAKYVAVNESTEIPDDVIATAPPGWDLKQMDPKQPTQNYAEYRKEKLRELGRPVNMPLMMTMLDSGDHNYSSARFDGQLYSRGVQSLQAWYDRLLLNRALRRVERNATLLRQLPRRPARVDFQWTWPVAPHVDPKKEADAWETLLRIGGASEFDVAASTGRDFETVMQARARAQTLAHAAGFPIWPPPAQPAATPPAAEDPPPRNAAPKPKD